MKYILSILKNRNTLLIGAIVFGLIFGDFAHHIKHLTFYILAIVLSFSTTGIVFSELSSKKEVAKSMLLGLTLNYFLFGSILLTAAYFLSPNQDIFYGFVIIAATPPGVAIIPFTIMLNGNLKVSILGTLGGFLSSIFLAPFIIKIFTGNDALEILPLFLNMLKIIVLPILISRVLLFKSLKSITLKIRGQVVNWGFALIIFTAIGINRPVFMSHYEILFKTSIILLIAVFVLGQSYDIILKRRGVNSQIRMSQNLILTLKSSGFAVVTAIELFDDAVVIPSAVLSIFVLSYLIFLSVKNRV